MASQPVDAEELGLLDGLVDALAGNDDDQADPVDLGDLSADPDADPPRPQMEVRVTRSARRKKTAQARLVDGYIDLRIPAHCSDEEEQHFVEHFRERFERARQSEEVDVEVRAAELADEYSLPHPTSVRWVSNQKSRWGSCTPAHGTIRLSDRMAFFPKWVVDYVLLHELAHLVEINHTPEFWALIADYPLAERARGYLIAKAEGS